MDKYMRLVRFISEPFEAQKLTIGRKDPSDENLTPKILLESIVSTCLTELDMEEIKLEFRNPKFLDIFSPVVSNTWKLSWTILEILCQLKNELENIEAGQTIEENKIELLSLQDQMYIQKCIEILIGFGILPYLLEGAFTFSHNIQEKSPYFKVSQEFVRPDRQLSDFEKFSRVEHVLKQVFEFTSYPTLFDIVFPRYLNEFLAALLQETKLPLARPRDDNETSSDKLTIPQFDYVMGCREQLSEKIPQFFDRIPKKFLATSVLIIGGSGARHIWLQRACTTILFETMCSPYGFMATCQAIYENLGGSDCDIWKVTRVVSTLLRSSFFTCFSINAQDKKINILKPKELLPPGRSPLLSDPTSIISEICKQSVQMISPSTTKYNSAGGSVQNKDFNVGDSHITTIIEANKNMSYIGIVSVFTLMEFDAQLTREMALTNIFLPILNLSQGQGAESQMLGSRVDQLVHCVRIAEALLITRRSIDLSYSTSTATSSANTTNVSSPSNIVKIPVLEDPFFQPIWSTIFLMYTTSYKYLKSKDQEPEISKHCTTLLNACSDVIFLLLELSTDTVSPQAQCFSLLFLNQVWKMHVDEESFYFLYWLSEFRLKFTLTKGSTTNPSQNPGNNDQKIVETQSNVNIVRQCLDKTGNVYTIKLLNDLVDILCQVFLKNSRLTRFSSQLLMEAISYKQGSCASVDDLQICEIKIIEASMNRMTSTSTSASTCTNDNLLGHSIKSPERTSTSSIISEEKILRLMNNCRNFVAAKLYQELGSEEPLVDTTLGENPEDSLKFLEIVMKKFVNDAECSQNQNTGGGEDQFPFSESLVLSLGVLSTFIESLCNDQQNSHTGNSSPTFKEPGHVWEKLQSFVPILEKLKNTNDTTLIRKGVPEQIKTILIAIESGGGFNSGVNSNKDRVQGPKLSRWDLAMKDSSSSQPPIKGHGLLELRKLLDENDPTANCPENLKMLLELFKKEMRCDDSYIYLMAIYGLASLGHKHPEQVIPILGDEYTQVRTFSHPDQYTYDSEGLIEEMNYRMKIGEVLVKLVGKLGESALYYRGFLINIFFYLARDEDPLIRASALSNMGELCHILKFNLGMILTEVWNLVYDILKFEKSVHVRRAALHLIVMCLKGVSKDFDQEMSDFLMKNLEIGQYLRDVRRLLMELRQTESDSVSSVHIQLALDEIDSIALSLISTQNSLESKFQTLGLSFDRKS